VLRKEVGLTQKPYSPRQRGLRKRIWPRRGVKSGPVTKRFQANLQKPFGKVHLLGPVAVPYLLNGDACLPE